MGLHILFLAPSFPSPEYPYRGAFLGNQVRLLCARPDEISRITVLSPTTYIPPLARGIRAWAAQSNLPDRYEFAPGRCEVLFPRYLKAPGKHLLRWTASQWVRILERTLSRLQKTFPVDLIHANSGGISSWSAIRAGSQYGIPCAVTYQGSEVHVGLARKHKGWELCRDSFRNADLNLCVSRSLENILRLHETPVGCCEVLLRGVDQSRFFPAPDLTRAAKVIFVGRVERAKGVFDLLAAWKKVRQSSSSAVLTVVGPDLTNGLFARQAAALGLGESIAVLPPVDSPAVADLLRQSRVFCLPSHGEGMPNVVAEAMACGLPVVATRVGGVENIVAHDKNGILVEKGDVDGLATALSELLNDYDSCSQMGKVGLAFARQHLDAHKSVDRLIELYKDLISRHSPDKSTSRRDSEPLQFAPSSDRVA